MKTIKYVLMLGAFALVTQVGAQDKGKLEKKFKKINADGNEFISKKELKTFYEGKTNKKGKPINANYLFLGTDKNGDGKISKEEYLSGFDKELAKKAKKAK